MILQVHNEFLFEVPEGGAEEIKTLVVVDEMEGVYELKVPLIVEANYSKNRAEIH